MRAEPNNTPIDPRVMADATGVSLEDVMDYFDRYFGGYEEYVKLCEAGQICDKLDELIRLENERN